MCLFCNCMSAKKYHRVLRHLWHKSHCSMTDGISHRLLSELKQLRCAINQSRVLIVYMYIHSSPKIKIANKNFLYLSSRWYGNQHPLNLAIVELPGNKASPSAPLLKPKLPKLKPFPSWEVQKLGDCSAIQFVQSMQVNTDKKSVENIFVKVTSIWTRTLPSGGGGGRSCLATR